MLISLVIPVYNLRGYLAETISSVCGACQAIGDNASDVEVIFVDDGSTDGSGALLDAATVEHGFRVVHQTNGGEGAARNAGIACAKGDYLMYLDGDDVLLPNALSEVFSCLRKYPEADIFSFRFAAYPDGSSRPAAVCGTAREISVSEAIPAELIMRLGVFPSVFRRSVASDLRFGDLPLGADRVYALSYLAQARSVVISESCVGGYRQRATSMAHLAWNRRKIESQGTHAVRALAALVACGKALDHRGTDSLASLVLSEVPARMARLGGEGDRSVVWLHWLTLVEDLPIGALSWRMRAMRGLILFSRRSRTVSVGIARISRFVGLS